MNDTLYNDMKIFYVASLCTFFFSTFKTDTFEKCIGEEGEFVGTEDVIENFYYKLKEHDEEYDALIEYFQAEQKDSDVVFGIEAANTIQAKDFASNLLAEIELLNHDNQKLTAKSVL